MNKEKLSRAIKHSRAWLLGVTTALCFALAVSQDPVHVLLVHVLVQVPLYLILLFIIYKNI